MNDEKAIAGEIGNLGLIDFVRGYTEICNMTAGKDHRTYELALAILNEEIEHESWFAEFLGEGPSGHFLRLGETSPFASKFFK